MPAPAPQQVPPRWLITLLSIVVIAIVLWSQRDEDQAPVDVPAAPPAVEAMPADGAAPISPAPIVEGEPSPPEIDPAKASAPRHTETKTPKTVETANELIVRQVTVKDQSGKVAYRGDVDLEPTLDRIARGERHSHRNDGGTFRNLEGRLPKQPTGYYKEYVHPTPGLSGPGPQRLILGDRDEVYYTADHYRTFKRIR